LKCGNTEDLFNEIGGDIFKDTSFILGSVWANLGPSLPTALVLVPFGHSKPISEIYICEINVASKSRTVVAHNGTDPSQSCYLIIVCKRAKYSCHFIRLWNFQSGRQQSTLALLVQFFF
jgi:hypothetical protein